MKITIESNFKKIMSNYNITGYEVAKKSSELGTPIRLATFYDLINNNSKSIRLQTIENILVVVNTILKENNINDTVEFKDLFTTIIKEWIRVRTRI